MTVTERFLNYTTFDTQSSEESQSIPSTPGQMVFAQYLAEELKREGLHDVVLDDKGYVYATLPENIPIHKEPWGIEVVPTIGFIAHYDTSPDCSGKGVKPRIVEHYDGGDITLSEGIVLSPSVFPEMLG